MAEINEFELREFHTAAESRKFADECGYLIHSIDAQIMDCCKHNKVCLTVDVEDVSSSAIVKAVESFRYLGYEVHAYFCGTETEDDSKIADGFVDSLLIRW